MFGKKTVDAVMLVFNKAIDELHAVGAHHDDKAAIMEQIANDAISARLKHMEESSRAARLIERLTEIVR